jgi:hypothetical protein
MAYQFSQKPSEVSEKSKKIERIDRLLMQLNNSWIAPLNKDPLSARYFYELIISLVETLSLEISSELEDTEFNGLEAQRKAIEIKIKEKPIFIYRFDDGLGGRRQRIVKNDANWSEIKEMLYKYDKDIRGYINNKLKYTPFTDSDSATAYVGGEDDMPPELSEEEN